MSLKRVTITGADDSVSPHDLIALGIEFPFVEWGILVSPKHAGSARFPSEAWIMALQAIVSPNENLSMHLCGKWLRDLLVGVDHLDPPHTKGFDRLQLNFHGGPVKYDLHPFIESLSRLGFREFIFQIDGAMGQEIIAAVHGEDPEFNAVPLFDLSHGAGKLPEKWPSPFDDVMNGYAGGLGPENLRTQIVQLGQVAGATPFWIDMETRVRSDGDRQFDLAKVRLCLEIAKEFIE